MDQPGGTTYGERLLRSAAVQAAAEQVLEEVRQQVLAALHGPFAGALAAGAGTQGQPAHQGLAGAVQAAEAVALLSADVPRRFIATGAALSAAYGGLASGEEARAAGALLCAQRLLFPDDPAGAAAVERATAAALQALDVPEDDATSGAAQSLEAMQHRVAAGADALERAFQAAAGNLRLAALRAPSFLAVTGGAAPGSNAAQSQFGPFLDGLVRWAFFTAAALHGVRRDDWSRAGAALVAALRDVQRGRAGFDVVPPS